MYDSCYHRRVARLCSLCWSVEETSLAQEVMDDIGKVVYGNCKSVKKSLTAIV